MERFIAAATLAPGSLDGGPEHVKASRRVSSGTCHVATLNESNGVWRSPAARLTGGQEVSRVQIPPPRQVRPLTFDGAVPSPSMPVRTVVERAPKGRKAVAFAVDWPCWS